MKCLLMWRKMWLAGIVAFLLSGGNCFSAEVDVYAEGAYSQDDLVVYIYADINGDKLLSYGVKSTYDPSDLANPSATKNEEVWFMGDGTQQGNIPYMDPETSTQGEIVFIGGKLDVNDPLGGVSGQRILLADARFDRISTDQPVLALSFGREGSYDNFVTTSGAVLDDQAEPAGVAFDVLLHQRGDANGDNVVNIFDMGAIKNYMVNGGIAHPWMDCNADGTINIFDMGCIKNIMTQ